MQSAHVLLTDDPTVAATSAEIKQNKDKNNRKVSITKTKNSEI